MKQVLVVDNDRIVLGLMSRFLAQRGYHVETAENGLSALDLLKDYAPGIFFIDLVMPNISGQQLCRIIRSMKRFDTAYLVILSAISAEERIDIRDLGVNAVIAKRSFDKMALDIAVVLDDPEGSSKRCLAGEILGVESVYRRGITEELLFAKRHLEIILGKMSEGVMEITSGGRIVFANTSMLAMVDIPETDVLGAMVVDLFEGDDRIRMADLMRDGAQRSTPVDLRINRREVTLDIVPMDHETRRSLIIVRDESGPRKAAQALQESEQRFRRFFEGDLSGAFITTPAGEVIECNPAFAGIFGFDSPAEAKRHGIDTIYVQDAPRDRFLEKLRKEKRLERHESVMRRNDGTRIHTVENTIGVFDDQGELVEVQGYLMDITEQKRLENRLRMSQKMETIGTIAGGVAHDLNNVLSGIVSYPDLILMQLPEDSPLRKPILTMKESGEKAAALVQDLLMLVRRTALVDSVVDLNEIVVNYLGRPEFETLQSHHSGIDIETDLADDLWPITGSAIHLYKVIMNLVSNSAEAIVDSGKIRIATENRYIDASLSYGERIKAGDYVVLSVSDNGVGISPEDIEKIFEPFYTKKVMGRGGTGLGMAVVWGVVKDHKGYIGLRSDVGQGTTFTLHFPASTEAIPAPAGAAAPAARMGQGESILIVDDVAMQRTVASNLLEAAGYTTHAVSSGEAAVEYLKRHAVDLVVLDMIMAPGMDGLDTYKKIVELRPGQKAIIASGFSESNRVKDAQALGAGAYIKKPYTLEKIALAVKQELERK